ncbi:MAG: hypothetical protein A4S09_04420 [Proteobacteria bacterium SG_bin7]|nr:MAG: hypothetical protein A4S09_04420 [Proteobacteria bacterium SG_bin7]
MGRQNMFFVVLLLICNMMTSDALAQSSQYQRKKKSAPNAEAAANPNPAPGAPADKKAAGAPAANVGKDEKLDVSGLEEKYWSSQDTDFTVVQNRTYTKAKRVSLSLSAGLPTNDSYSSGTFVNSAVNYYFDERHGVEVSYSSYPFKNSTLVDTFSTSNGALPDMNRDKYAIGVNYNFVPIYAKASLLGSKIMYFDFAVSPGLAMVTYEQFVDPAVGNKTESTIAYALDFSQQFFLSKEFALRIDFKNRWQQQKVLKYRNGGGGAATGSELRNEMFHSSFLLFGLTYFF